MADHVRALSLVRRAAHCAAAATLIMFAVVAASAYIRLALAEGATPAALVPARAAHRVTASLTALAVIVLALLVFRSRACDLAIRAATAAALVVTLALSALGVVTGMHPPPVAQFANLYGGLLLLALLAWLHGALLPPPVLDPASRPALQRLAWRAIAVFAVQAALGAGFATLATRDDDLLLLAHAAAGLAAAAIAGALGLRLAGPGLLSGALLLFTAAFAPVAGAASALLKPAALAGLVHPLLAAAMLGASAHALARIGRKPPPNGAASLDSCQ